MKVEELKEQARRHEQREEWQKAFDLYSTALGFQSEDEAPDIALLNRVGDIQTRLGQIDGAVGRYERAIDLYMEAELPNNAIAICKKVLRNLPDRNVFFLRMGQIRASQGFLTDARQSFLEYAERQTAAGDVESALNALIEFVELSPEDVEIRRGLASQLEAHGRTEEAIQQYNEIYRLLVLLERGEDAEEISAKLKELDPETALPDPESVRAGDSREESEDLVVEATSLGGLDLDDWSTEVGLESIETELEETSPSSEPERIDGAPGEQEELPAFDFDAEELGEEVEVLSGYASEEMALDSPGSEGAEGDQSDADDGLPLITFGEEPTEGEEDLEPLPIIGIPESDEEAEGAAEAERLPPEFEDLPLLGLEGESEGVPPDAAVESALADEAFEADRVDLAEEEAEPEWAPPEGGGEGHQEAADRGDMELAIERVKAEIRANPNDLQLHQRLVEYAFRRNDQPTLVSAYMELAGCLARTGASNKARAVYQQVLSLSPGHEGAMAGILGMDRTPPGAPRAQVASSQDYVDLGSMVLEAEDRRSTRWTVPTEAPSGDEAADFARMLEQFKEKVSEHLAADDVGAHHDLGTAYMEMGLLDEAIAEFQMALRAAPGHLPTHEVMGRCWMEMDKPDMAIRGLSRALSVEYEIEDELIGIYYLMGRAQEAEGNISEALEFYEKVFSLDINFEDVTERLRALR